MEQGLEDFELFEAYFEGRMEDSAKTAFETRLLIDLPLKEEFDLYITLRTGIYKAGEAELRSKLKAADKEMDRFVVKKTKTPAPAYTMLLVAASIAVLITASYFFLTPDKFKFKEFEERDQGMPVLMSGEGQDKFSKSMVQYKRGNFTEAKKALEMLMAESPDNDTVIYYLGVTNYEIKNYDAALDYFQRVLKTDNFFREKTEYRIGLNFLRLNRQQAAKSVFEKIALEPNHLYKERANEILREF
jgi:tetratricopeptide (TPR) repeat protein